MIAGVELLTEAWDHIHAIHSIEELIAAVPPIEWALVHFIGKARQSH